MKQNAAKGELRKNPVLPTIVSELLLLACSITTTSPWLPGHFPRHPHQLLIFLLASQAKPNKQANCLPSSPISLVPSLYLCLPTCFPISPPLSLSLSQLFPRNSFTCKTHKICLIVEQHWLLFKTCFIFCC